ncbi:hypothetical protein EJ08DRAFT_695479 [Tothia fuscella]|uniref:Heterokaryon incompatibility domain-containing protein n=1 Tax=Tothia fuscella TaxID=1048955 RepID=A0A9P4U0W4_9PEZI|nr:hypothetical protein EJ08DRAFT_695479 [Tothia fuscella]
MGTRNPFSAVFSHYNFHLAVLEPSPSETDTIQVSLSNTNRTDVSYECISYDRSQDYGSTSIQLNDAGIDIPVFLETALRRLRKKDESRLLWADVLLGRDLETQGAEAAIAKTVLQNAKRTVVWLGGGDAKTAEAFKVIMTLAQWWHQASARTGFPVSFSKATSTQMDALMVWFSVQDGMVLEPDDATLWKSLLAVFQASYWESVQAIPDLILSTDAIITSGAGSISWPDFTAAFQALMVAMPQLLNKIPSKELQNSFIRVSGIAMADRRFRDDDGLELLPMIQTARECRSADPREYVFAMLPIVRPSKRTATTGKKIPLPVADYGKSVQDIFTETAKFVIEERQDLLIWWTERAPNARKIKDLPSWAPDWTSGLPTVVVKPTAEGHPSLRSWWENIPDRKPIAVTDNKLHLQAHRLDRISTVSKMFTEENCRRLLLQEWQALPHNPNQSLKDKVDMYWRTIILNIGGATDALRKQAPPPQDMWISWQSILAEERILELMACTPEQLLNDPAIRERARADEQCQILGPQVGQSDPFEELLRKNAIGRRFFTTENGRMGMTAYERTAIAEGENGEEAAKAEIALNEIEMPTESNRDDLLGGLGSMMMGSFQEFLMQRDPNAAAAMAEVMQKKEKARGARVGDVIVAAVGGFHPYVLRAVEGGGSSDIKGREFRFVGDAYLHGVMGGEPFLRRNWIGVQTWRTDVRVDDVVIV